MPSSLEQASPFAAVRHSAAIIIVLFSAVLALASSSFPKLALGFWGVLLLGALLFLVRLKPIEILIFLIPLMKLTIAFTAGLQEHFVLVVIGWMALLLFWWLVESLSTGTWTLVSVRTPAIYALLGYTAIFILSLLAHRLNRRSLNHTFNLLTLIGVYWILVQSLRGLNYRRAIKALIFGSALCALQYDYLFLTGSPIDELAGLFLGITRPSFGDYSSNAWAYPAMIGMPLLVVMITYGEFKGWQLALALFSGFLMAAQLFLSSSRSVYAAVIVSALVVMVTHPKGRKLLLGCLGATVAVILVIMRSVTWSEVLYYNVFRLNSGLSGRSFLWIIAQNFISAHPLLGIGPGWFYERMVFDSPPMGNTLDMLRGISNAHNTFLMTLAELGIFAIVPLLFIIGFFFYRAVRLWPVLKGKPDFPILQSLIALMLAGLMRSLFEADFFMLYGYLSDNLVLLFALAVQDHLYAREFRSHEPAR